MKYRQGFTCVVMGNNTVVFCHSFVIMYRLLFLKVAIFFARVLDKHDVAIIHVHGNAAKTKVLDIRGLHNAGELKWPNHILGSSLFSKAQTLYH